MLRGIILLWQVICLSLLLISPANAATIVFDNFGPGDSYDTVDTWGIVNNVGDETYNFASPFVPSASGNVSDIWLVATLFSGSNNLAVALMNDSGGQPGSVIETWSFVNKMDGLPGTLLHGTGSGTVQITAGSQYWLVVSAPESGTYAGWHKTSPAVYAIYASSYDAGFSGPWYVDDADIQPVFRIAVNSSATAVPTMNEWGMIIFIVLAGLGGVYYMRRQKRANS